MPSGSSAVSAAPISEPSSIVPVSLDRDVADDGDAAAVLLHRPVGAEDGGLGLQQVLAGLDEDRVGAALEHGPSTDST